jgi:hypothetical protein
MRKPAAQPKKPVPLWPALIAGALLLFLIYCAIAEHRRRETKKQEILDLYFPELAIPNK